MRTIKFRGKSKFNSEWVYGDLVQCMSDDVKIVNSNRPKDLSYRINDIQSDTVGQFTGLLDKNGKEIYEGDVVHLGDPRITYVLLWLDCGLKAKQIGAYGSFCGVTYWAETMTIVGNIHDNPELLKNND